MLEYGTVVEVSEELAGSSLAVDVASGATLLPVGEASDFDERGGQLTINGAVLTYAGVNMVTDTIALDPVTPLPAAALQGDAVSIYPDAPIRSALVSLEYDGDAVIVRVPHHLAAMLPLGVREPDQQESVTIDRSSAMWVIQDVIGRPATVQGAAVDVTTLDPVENISPDYTYPGDIPMTNVTGGLISAVFETPDVGSGVMRLSDIFGLQSLRSDGSARFDLPNSDDRAISIDAEIITNRFTSLDEFALRGVNNEIAKDAVVTLQRGTTQPITPPSVSISWDSIPFDDALGLSSRWYGLVPEGTDWWRALAFRPVSLTVSGGILERVDATGNLTANFPITVDPEGGVTLLGGNLYVLGKRITGQFGQIVRWYVERYDTSGNKIDEWEYVPLAGGKAPCIGNDGTNLLFAQCAPSGVLRFDRRAPGTGAIVGSAVITNLSPNQDSGAVLYGAFDYGANHYVWAPRVSGGGVARVFNASGTEQTTERFNGADSVRVAGMAWDGTNFRSLGQGTPRLHTYSGIRRTETPWWVGNTWRRADATGPDFAQYETKLGNSRKFNMTRRAKLIVNTAPIPAGAGGPDSADSMTLYFGTNATLPANAGFFRRSTPAAGVTSVEFETMDFSGGNPPTAGTFPNANPARLASDDPALLSIDGNGSVTAPKKMQCGSVVVPVPSGQPQGTPQTVTFPVQFDANPIVVTTVVGNAAYRAYLTSTPGGTSCQVNVRHGDSTNAGSLTNVTVHWHAMVP